MEGIPQILIEKYHNRIRHTDLTFVRSLLGTIHKEARLVGIRGARGVGKTTMMLQYIKQNLYSDQTAFYVSLDHIGFTGQSLVGLADAFVKSGGTHLFLDEVHKYPNWAQELKNCYDDYPELRIWFTGSSMLEILNARADLSRRAVMYDMQGLSYREYLAMHHQIHLTPVGLEDILKRHLQISNAVLHEVRPLKHFSHYLAKGYYPFYRENPDLYEMRIGEVIQMILEVELPLMRQVDIGYIPRVRQLLGIIAAAVPFVPNISKLSEKIGLNRATLLAYIYYLNEAGLLRNLFKAGEGISKLQKPGKILLDNPNLLFALAPDNANTGNLRETFFVNQMAFKHLVNWAPKGDFLVNNQCIIEVGGKNKTKHQIRSIPNSYVVADGIEYGTGNRIPLWMFGLMY
jgi:uncharacterized protein